MNFLGIWKPDSSLKSAAARRSHMIVMKAAELTLGHGIEAMWLIQLIYCQTKKK